MKRWSPFFQLVLARFREFYREPEVLFWVYGFPLVLAIGLGIAFSGSKPEPPAVDVQQDGPADLVEAAVQRLKEADVHAEVHSPEESLRRLTTGKTALVVVVRPGAFEYVYDEARGEGVLARYWIDSILSRRPDSPAVQETKISEPGSRYIDFLLPGLIGMNIMGGGLFGVGFVIVDMRVRRLFKRLVATPMRHSDYLLAILSARMFFLLPEMISLLVVARLLFGVPIRGSLLLVLAFIFLGAAAFSGIGLVLGSRTDKTETMSGFINLVMLPMYLLSGIFFSPRHFPDAVQPFIQVLPLTHINEGLREVMLQGEGLTTVGWRLLILAAWSLVTFTLALRWFRWR